MSPTDGEPLVDDWQQRVDALWQEADLDDAEASTAAMRSLVAELDEDDARGPFELGGMYDSVGREQEAAEQYERALSLGLDQERTARLTIQHASTLRNLGQVEEAVALLEAMTPHPSVGSAREAFLALALHASGRPDQALRVALEGLVPHLPRYQRSVTAYAAEL
ncbi:tetratricopeptide repeat protein [Auraticoccus monumenti]|uniref:Tetratrico peptide repeat-containing protein n=1 Tax=Auraticoccus monumenti TaxID=675864 RepID=A0A1G7EW54_9ACTN|nr:tetratricopeptide repeat protein [Auraticoccus monumenti]SDE67857.1 Tetratrico peptide repeat-containing protein [Auraticoccus monumenti]